MDGEDDDDPGNRNYQVSEADDERNEEEESVIPQFEQEYQEMEIPASEFYENYDEESEKESMAVMTIMPIDKATDVIAASDIGPKPKGPVEKDNRNFRIWSSGKLRERPQVKPEDKECLVTSKHGHHGIQEALRPASRWIGKNHCQHSNRPPYSPTRNSRELINY